MARLHDENLNLSRLLFDIDMVSKVKSGWTTYMACKGSEISLRDCPYAGLEVISSNCNGHTEDAVVQCSGYTGEYQGIIIFHLYGK